MRFIALRQGSQFSSRCADPIENTSYAKTFSLAYTLRYLFPLLLSYIFSSFTKNFIDDSIKRMYAFANVKAMLKSSASSPSGFSSFYFESKKVSIQQEESRKKKKKVFQLLLDASTVALNTLLKFFVSNLRTQGFFISAIN